MAKYFFLFKEVPAPIKEEIKKVYPKPYLFGSRKMTRDWGWLDSLGSDWDFAFPYKGSELEENKLMEGLGWVNKPTEKYKDIMHFQTWEKTVDTYKIQMCSKINLNTFSKVFDRMSTDFYWEFFHKSSDKVLPKEMQTKILDQMYYIADY